MIYQEISNADQGGKEEWLNLLITYSKKKIPADIEEIATRQKNQALGPS